MLYEEAVPPTMTMVLAMGPKLLVKSAVERNLPTKARDDYTSGEVAQLCADAVHVIKRSGVEYEEASGVYKSARAVLCGGVESDGFVREARGPTPPFSEPWWCCGWVRCGDHVWMRGGCQAWGFFAG